MQTCMAAPMLQRLTLDGSLETPSVIDDPFKVFPRCSVTLYREMGMKGDIFKFPLFYCSRDTRLWEEGITILRLVVSLAQPASSASHIISSFVELFRSASKA